MYIQALVHLPIQYLHRDIALISEIQSGACETFTFIYQEVSLCLKVIYLLFVKYLHGKMLARLFVFHQHDSTKRPGA